MLTLAERFYHATQTPYTDWLVPSEVQETLKWVKEIPYQLYFHDNNVGREDLALVVEGLKITVWVPLADSATRRGHFYSIVALVYLCSLRGTTPSVTWNYETGCIIVPYVKDVRVLTAFLECHPDHFQLLTKTVPYYETVPNFGFAYEWDIARHYHQKGLSPITVSYYTDLWIDTRPPKPKKKLPKYADGHEDPTPTPGAIALAVALWMGLLTMGVLCLWMI